MASGSVALNSLMMVPTGWFSEKAMTAEEKVPYEDKAKEAKAAYVVKLKEYEATKAADKPTVIDDDDDDESDDDDDGSGSD